MKWELFRFKRGQEDKREAGRPLGLLRCHRWLREDGARNACRRGKPGSCWGLRWGCQGRTSLTSAEDGREGNQRWGWGTNKGPLVLEYEKSSCLWLHGSICKEGEGADGEAKDPERVQGPFGEVARRT